MARFTNEQIIGRALLTARIEAGFRGDTRTNFVRRLVEAEQQAEEWTCSDDYYRLVPPLLAALKGNDSAPV